jgi:ABC-type transporter Mla maintaining outer membrane lipid asymmetry ATPase subunit MlaF
MPEEVLKIEGVTKGYQGLRPLRLASLTLSRGERVSIAGFDAPAGELMVNLVTGAVVPDQGSIWTFGRRTTDIANADDWLAWLDHFGIVSERGVLLEGATLQQNLAMPFSLEIEPVPANVAEQVGALVEECGLQPELLQVRAGDLPPEARLRAHLARAVALSPRLLLIEHPTATVVDGAREALASDIGRVCDRRELAALVITNDEPFAEAVAATNLKLDAATGNLRALKRKWFRW